MIGAWERNKDMSADRQSESPQKLSKTEARQGRVVGNGRIAKIMMTSLAALVVIGILLFVIF
jgi:hypothetical protein